MEKTQLNNYIMLSFCSTVLHFMIGQQTGMIFPRDRIIHTLISFAIFFIFIYILQYINWSKGILKYIVALALFIRAGYMIYAFTHYFQTFYGSNTVALIILSVAVAIMVYSLDDNKISQLYGFFLILNIFMITVIVILSADRFNVANIYTNNTDFIFSFSKTYIFFDVITLAAVLQERKQRVYAQKRYMVLSTMFIVTVTLIQGLCVRGNMLYSVSPLQSLFQVYSGNTIKRYDYLFAIIQTINYFAAIILYINAVRKLFITQKEEMYEKD